MLESICSLENPLAQNFFSIVSMTRRLRGVARAAVKSESSPKRDIARAMLLVNESARRTKPALAMDMYTKGFLLPYLSTACPKEPKQVWKRRRIPPLHMTRR